jgi:hypothetical protein
VRTDKPIIRARYDYADLGSDTLTRHIEALLARLGVGAKAAAPC